MADSIHHVYYDDDLDPSEKDVIESVKDSIESEEQTELSRAFERAVFNGNKQYLYWDRLTIKFIV